MFMVSQKLNDRYLEAGECLNVHWFNVNKDTNIDFNDKAICSRLVKAIKLTYNHVNNHKIIY